jgi:hypothetical protein
LRDQFALNRAECFRPPLPANLTGDPADLALLLSGQFLCASSAPESTKGDGGRILSGHDVLPYHGAILSIT